MPQTTTAHPDSTSDSRYLTGPEVCARYGIVPMSLWRWLSDTKYADLEFPRPAFRVRDRRYWREADLIDWERRRARAAAGARTAKA
jgi:predicted DNA-binding transcriptional regulator AlpA